MKKSLIAVLLITVMLFMACGKELNTPESTTPAETEEATTEEVTTEEQATEEETTEEPTTEEPTTEEPTTEELPTEKPTYPDDGKAMSVEDMYKGVINGTRSFHYGKQNITYGLEEYLDQYENREYVYIGQFIYFDYDGDSVKDVALSIAPGYILYLTCKDGEIYGMDDTFRGASWVYSNGVTFGEGGAYVGGYSKLSFENGEVVHNELCHFNFWQEEYRVEGKNVTREEAEAYEKQMLSGTEEIEWIDFTPENIEKYIVGEN